MTDDQIRAIWNRTQDPVAVAREVLAAAAPQPAGHEDDIEAVIACLSDDAATLRDENAECEIAANMDAAAATITSLMRQLDEARSTPQPLPQPSRELLVKALERMDRARAILTDGNPRPNCNWGVLDTSDLRASLGGEVPGVPQADKLLDGDTWWAAYEKASARARGTFNACHFNTSAPVWFEVGWKAAVRAALSEEQAK